MNVLASDGKSPRPETITVENQYACHNLSIWNKQQKSPFSTKTKPSRAQSTHHRKNSLEKSSILAQDKSCVLPIILTSFLHVKLITFQWIQVTDNDLADRWLGITRQEGRIAVLNVCLQALTFSLPSPCDFFTLSPNREPVHRLLLCWHPTPVLWRLNSFFLFKHFYLLQ